MNPVLIEKKFHTQLRSLVKIRMYRGTSSNEDLYAGISYWATNKEEAMKYYKGTLLARDFFFTFGVFGELEIPNDFKVGSKDWGFAEVDESYKFGIMFTEGEHIKANINDDIKKFPHFYMSISPTHLDEKTVKVYPQQSQIA
jgi:hypothetical protein